MKSSTRTNSRSNSPINSRTPLSSPRTLRHNDLVPPKVSAKSILVNWERIRSFSHNPVPKKRKGQSTVVYKNKMYMFGGYFGSHAGDLWVYVPDSTRWKRLDISGIVPAKRTGHCACLYNSKMVSW
jgi:hypothetical protein